MRHLAAWAARAEHPAAVGTRLRLGLLAAALVLTTVAAFPAQEGAPPAPDTSGAGDDAPPLDEIIARMIERAERQDESESELRYESRIVTTSNRLDGAGEITETETREHRRYPLEGELYEELIARDGRPLDAGEQREEREKRDEFVREARERAREGGGGPRRTTSARSASVRSSSAATRPKWSASSWSPASRAGSSPSRHAPANCPKTRVWTGR